MQAHKCMSFRRPLFFIRDISPLSPSRGAVPETPMGVVNARSWAKQEEEDVQGQVSLDTYSLQKRKNLRSRIHSFLGSFFAIVEKPSMPDIDDKFLPLLSEYVEKNINDLEQLKASATKSAGSTLIQVDIDIRGKLSKLPNRILQIGLFDPRDEELLRLSLWDAAGSPAGTNFNKEDRSTWSLESLRDKKMLDLVELQCYAGSGYKCLLSQYFNIMVLNEYNSNNIVPFPENVFAVDKSCMRDTGDALMFILAESAFESGTKYNPKDKLQKIRELLFEEDLGASSETLEKTGHDMDKVKKTGYELRSSPLHSVTLSDAGRAKAGIPLTAAFYCFCYPVIQDPNVIDKIHEMEVDLADPFVVWLTTGAFMYFDYHFDILGINAVSIQPTEVRDDKCPVRSLCMGQPSHLPRSAIEQLHGWGRWSRITIPLPDAFDFTHFAYITPSEFIGDHIFPRSGGFAYLHRDDLAVDPSQLQKEKLSDEIAQPTVRKSVFLPVVDDKMALDDISADERGLARTVDKVTGLQQKSPEIAVKIVRKLAEQLRQDESTPLLYDTPLHVAELSTELSGEVSAQKFFISCKNAVFAAGEVAARGLPCALGYKDRDIFSQLADEFGVAADAEDRDLRILEEETNRIDEGLMRKLCDAGAVWLRDKESAEKFLEELKANVRYVLKETAKEEKVGGNNANAQEMVRDKGRQGWSLNDFWKQREAKAAHLSKAEVAALRLYTSSTFRMINGPLRAKCETHPLAGTTMLISEALKKLRALHMHTKNFKTMYLWRGMRDRTVSEEFMVKGGTELACMSTSSDLRVVASYAKSNTPLLFRLKVDSPMELGAELDWLSLYPGEREVLYPPLTFAKPLFSQSIKSLEGGRVVTLKPSFPT